MQTIKFIVALCIVISMAWCFDLIMNHVTKDITGFGKYLSYIGRFSIGYFFFGDIVLKRIIKKLEE